ncbi:DUF4878 domain-containing protein [Candidatus Leptofilum sp.]|uniref:DUF4878 domain-containing protein n=1 Tax=Candidatus Leptofilum sp. TaxID=3241576 RepID=UPI003B5A0FE6
MKKYTLLLLVLFGMFMLTGCSSGPGKVVERFFQAIEAGEITEAIGYLSSGAVQSLGEDKWRALLSQGTADIEADGGLDKIDIISEEVTGETAEVEVEFTYGNGNQDSDTVDLIEEDGDWKIHVDPYSK